MGDTSEADGGGWAAIVGPCYTAESLARALGWTRTDVTKAAQSRTILELETSDGSLVYPAFQLWNGAIINGIRDVIQVLHSGTRSSWTWAQWLNTAVDDETGEPALSAIEQMRAGHLDDVLLDARHTAAAWRS